MLSRVAERIYWMGRYMERAENTARLINVNANLLLDLPKGSQIGWLTLVDIAGANEEFTQKEIKNEEQAIMRFLLSDNSSPISIITSLRMARENARTSREIIPTETWELINDLYLYAKENASKSISRGARNRFLRHVMQTAQQYTGLLAGSMSQTNAYDFIRIGRNIERADMTTRIVDVGTVNLITNSKNGGADSDAPDPFVNLLWMSVLQSLSAYQMYRQHVFDRVNGEDVVAFLLQNADFPRAVASCFKQMKVCLNKLSNNDEALRSIGTAQRRIDQADIQSILATDKLHDLVDILQLDIANVHDEIAKAWFLPRITAESA